MVPPPKPPRLKPPVYHSPPPYLSPVDKDTPPPPPPSTVVSSYNIQHSFREELPSSASTIQNRPTRPPWSTSSDGTTGLDIYEDIHSFNEEEPSTIVNNVKSGRPPTYTEAVDSSSGSSTPLSGSVLHLYDSATLTRLKQGTIENRSHPVAFHNQSQSIQMRQGVDEETLPRPPAAFDDEEENYERARQPVMIRLKGEGHIVEASDAVGLRFDSAADSERFVDRLRQLQLEQGRVGRNISSNGYGGVVTVRSERSSASNSPSSSVSSQPRENEGPAIEPPPSEMVRRNC